MYVGIASGKYNNKSYSLLPLNLLVLINQAGTIPNKKEKKIVNTSKYKVLSV